MLHHFGAPVSHAVVCSLYQQDRTNATQAAATRVVWCVHTIVSAVACLLGSVCACGMT
jgi:hypothetical protein